MSDDINCNSAIEDALHGCEVFELASGAVQPGDLLCYPTFTLLAPDGTHKQFIGHVGIVTGVRALEWDWAWPQYELLDIAQCKGPNGRKPAVVATDGSLWAHHDTVWPKVQHRTRVLRARG